MTDRIIELPPLPDHWEPSLTAFVLNWGKAAIEADRQRRSKPVAYAAFADNGNIRLWSSEPLRSPHSVPLYAGPQPVGNTNEHVGIAGTMPGTSGFTMACFTANKVPAGTKIYTAPQPDEPVKMPSKIELLKAIVIYADARATITENRFIEVDRHADMNAHDECAQAYADILALLDRFENHKEI